LAALLFVRALAAGQYQKVLAPFHPPSPLLNFQVGPLLLTPHFSPPLNIQLAPFDRVLPDQPDLLCGVIGSYQIEIAMPTP